MRAGLASGEERPHPALGAFCRAEANPRAFRLGTARAAASLTPTARPWVSGPERYGLAQGRPPPSFAPRGERRPRSPRAPVPAPPRPPARACAAARRRRRLPRQRADALRGAAAAAAALGRPRRVASARARCGGG